MFVVVFSRVCSVTRSLEAGLVLCVVNVVSDVRYADFRGCDAAGRVALELVFTPTIACARDSASMILRRPFPYPQGLTPLSMIARIL